MRIFFLTLCSALILACTAGASSGEKGHILLVLTNHRELGSTGRPTGFFLSEAAHPWEVFQRAGYGVQLASPAGGAAPVDPTSFDLKDAANAQFWKTFGNNSTTNPQVPETKSLAKVNPADYVAIFFAGGHGTMWDFPDSTAVQNVTAAIYEAGGAVGAVCHGPAALVNVPLSDGTPLVSERQVAPFTNAEEAAVELTKVVPFLLADALAARGAKLVQADNFQENAVRDGRLITGQNPASATKAATLLVEALQDK